MKLSIHKLLYVPPKCPLLFQGFGHSLVSGIWAQPGDRIDTEDHGEFHYYVKSNLFPDLKMLFWSLNSLLIKHDNLHHGSQLFHEAEMYKKYLLTDLIFNFFLASQNYHYSENIFTFWNKICPKSHTSKLCISLFDITQGCNQLLTRNWLLVL